MYRRISYSSPSWSAALVRLSTFPFVQLRDGQNTKLMSTVASSLSSESAKIATTATATRTMTECGDEKHTNDVNDSSEHVLLKRHYSTIGISDVFLQPPPCEYLPWTYLRNQQRQPHSQQKLVDSTDPPPSSFESWEIIGTIKTTPQDFIVREIAASNRTIPGLSPDQIIANQVADLPNRQPDGKRMQEYPASQRASVQNVVAVDAPIQNKVTNIASLEPVHAPIITNQQVEEEKEEEEVSTDKQNHAEEESNSIKLVSDDHNTVVSTNPPANYVLSPREVVATVLEHLYADGGDGNLTTDPSTFGITTTSTAEAIMSSLDQLQQQALHRIQQWSRRNNENLTHTNTNFATEPTGSDDNNSSNSICIRMISSEGPSCLPNNNNNEAVLKGGDRGEFHRALRMTFSMLKSEVIHATEEKEAHIRISVDDALDEIIPFLYQPEVDLVRLYQMRRRGINKDRRQGSREDDRPLALRLLPTLARERRRDIHQILERTCPEFTRNTDPNYPLHSEENASETSPVSEQAQQQHQQQPKTTAAITLWWSKRAQRQSTRKRKRGHIDNDDDSTIPSSAAAATTTTTPFRLSHTVCVMKKIQTEHMSAIHHLKTIVRCTASDIGLAGIKDMQAITYQFCTFREVSPHRLMQANESLNKLGIELGKCYPVDWQLNQGDLYGNRFDIVVRGLQRVQVKQHHNNSNSMNSCGEEQFIPCDRQHVLDMVHRIQTHGFINFYGDQRVGVPGHPSQVGVRSFDVGRAMLQQDFAKAIDLIITGRTHSKENAATRNARQVWKTSGGDAVVTLKAMPKGAARERMVLQGIKRYGSDNPLAAIKCLHFSVRSFWINAYQSYVWNKMASRRMELFGPRVVIGDLFVTNDELRDGDVEVVKQGMTDSVPLSQVVLPLPGFNIRYPENQIGEEYLEFLKNEGVSFDRDAPPEATAKGIYRRLIATVENMCVTFENETSSESVQSMKLTFDLKRGSYATSMLRELMLTTVSRDTIVETDRREC